MVGGDYHGYIGIGIPRGLQCACASDKQPQAMVLASALPTACLWIIRGRWRLTDLRD